MSKTIKYSEDSRKGLLKGVSIISKAVKGTLGPSGKNVLIRNRNGEKKPFATKDGATVAGQISSDDYLEQQAIELVQDVANNADAKAGDGTTTATILTEAIFKNGSEVNLQNLNVIDMKRGIDLGVLQVVKDLKELSVPCDGDDSKLLEVGMISSNNDKEIAEVVLEAYNVAGKQGTVNIKRSRTTDTYLTTIKGVVLETGFVSRYFVNNFDNESVEFNNPYIYMTNEKVTSVTDNFDALIQTISAKQASLLIICKDIDPMVLGMLVENHTKGTIKVAVCKAPGFGDSQNEELRDLGVVMGMNPFLEMDGLDFNTIDLEGKPETILEYLPQSEAIMLTKNRLSIKGPINIDKDMLKSIEIQKTERTDSLRRKLVAHLSEFEKSQIQTRISRLSNGIAFINIGAVSDIEFEEKQHRIQDALYAVKSAAEEGIIPGGGTALLYISDSAPVHPNKSMQHGIDIVYKAIEIPFLQILENVGIHLPPEDIMNFKKHFNTGIDARKNVPVNDMLKAGIIDPVKVTRVALENAASIAGMLLTTDCVIIDNLVYENNNAQAGLDNY